MPISASARDLISKLLQSDSAKRLTAEEALSHPWLIGNTADEAPLSHLVLSGLRTFDAQCKLKQTVLKLMGEALTDDEVENLKAAFSAMDEDGDGTITMGELKKAMSKHISENAEFQPKQIQMQEIERIMEKADVDGNGSLSYEELMMSFVHQKMSAKEERLWDAFVRIDEDRNGRITVDELEKVMEHLHDKRDKKELKKILDEVDKDKDGTVDFEEFIALFWTAEEQAESERKKRTSEMLTVDRKEEKRPEEKKEMKREETKTKEKEKEKEKSGSGNNLLGGGEKPQGKDTCCNPFC
jgi:calcium-dependent protein kinase